MGHIHLVVLPRSKKWQDVVSLLTDGASTDDVVSGSALAAENDLLGASSDPVFVEAVRLMLAIPYAARAEDFALALRQAGLSIKGHPELFDILVAVTGRLDQVARDASNRTDLGELAGRALSATLTTAIGDQLPGLFEATADDVQAAARKLSWSKGISEVSRTFFGHLLSETLSSWLDRELASHIGIDARYKSAADRSGFDIALAQYTSESTRIIQEFAGGWYGKTTHRDHGVDTPQARVFGAVALRKIVEEMRLKRGPS